jgi:hypothetical protein
MGQTSRKVLTRVYELNDFIYDETVNCEILGSHGCVAKVSSVLRCHAVTSHRRSIFNGELNI